MKKIAKKTARRAARRPTSERPLNKRLAKLTAAPPSKPKVDAATKERPTFGCLCGCGGTTKTNFQQGHDMRAKSALKARLGERFEAALAKAGSVAALARANGYEGGRPEKDAPKPAPAKKKKTAAKKARKAVAK